MTLTTAAATFGTGGTGTGDGMITAFDGEAYWHDSGLAALIDQCGTGDGEGAYPPDPRDLVRLHRLVRQRFAVTVLEFGVGYSTLALAHALALNAQDYDGLAVPPRLRAPHPFRLFSVDANGEWLRRSAARLPTALARRVTFHHSDVHALMLEGQLCHLYDRLPDVVPDLIYLDGPDPADVRGAPHGLGFGTSGRTVMAADPLLFESTLLPGAAILCDGRTNNARFLARQFRRPFKVSHDPEGDVTLFELDEAPLGADNAARLGLARHTST